MNAGIVDFALSYYFCSH